MLQHSPKTFVTGFVFGDALAGKARFGRRERMHDTHLSARVESAGVNDGGNARDTETVIAVEFPYCYVQRMMDCWGLHESLYRLIFFSSQLN